jgi:hypothetical protein
MELWILLAIALLVGLTYAFHRAVAAVGDRR